MDYQTKFEDLITSEVNASIEAENGTFLATTNFRYSIPISGNNDKPVKIVSEPKFDEDGETTEVTETKTKKDKKNKKEKKDKSTLMLIKQSKKLIKV